ncbi:MAG: porin [Burkholderiales bacterium]|nr:porin [Burkholderiales bacterium]
MRKSWIAAAVTAACAIGAQAQSTVQLAGTADMYVGSLRMAGDTSSRNIMGSGGLTTSWFGFSGSEDLGGGLKANFAITSFIQVNNGEQGRFVGDPLFSRDANLGISGNFGSVILGRWLAPNFLPSVIGNPLGDSFVFAPLILHMNVPLFNGTGWQATTPADTGWSNQIAYTTPDLGGLKATLHYQLGNLPSDSGKHNIGVSFLYFGGPLTLTGFYERDQVSNPGTSVYLGTTRTDWMLTGSYDLKFVKPYLGYGQAKADGAPGRAQTLHLGASAPLGGGSLLASWARTKVTAFDISRNTLTVGYDYNLSKRTDLYGMYMNDRITNQKTGNSLAVGMRHRF